MEPKRWRQIEDLYHAALTQEVARRAALLDAACAGDHELRREVESLLACDESAARLLETPALNVAAMAMADDHVNDMVGQQIGGYTLISRLGAGGMGEVYLAEDTRLKRKVAIKFLPLKSLTDEQARKRLLREAQAVARLDHPNICAVHEIGEHDGAQFIVMQYVEGETLAARIERQPLELNETLSIAIQIADALSEAHAQGIIHRDIKPQNVMINLRGQVKVLDFGLAKAIGRQVCDPEDETQSLSTLPGVIIGTAPYMSPEQVRGEILDARSDVFSFGTMLYELITGTRPFAAESVGATLAAVLTAEPPPLANYRPGVPDGLQGIVNRCLEKERSERYQATTEVSTDLDMLRRASEFQVAGGKFGKSSTASDTARPATRYRRSTTLVTSRTPLALAVTAIILVVGALIYSGVFRHVPTSGPSERLGNDRPVNPAAVKLYLDSRYHSQRKNLKDNQAAIGLLEQAVAIDDGFAMAYVDLGLMYMDNATYFAPEEKEWQEKAAGAIERAGHLNPDLPEFHLARGILLWTPFNHFPHAQAAREFRLALEKNPNLEEAHHRLAAVYLHVGLLDKALAELQRTLDINPSNTPARFRIGVVCHDQGKYEEALLNLKTVPTEFNPAIVIPQTVWTLFNLGRKDEAAELIEKSLKSGLGNDGGQLTSLQAMLLAAEGKESEAEAKIKQASEQKKGFIHFHHTAYNIATAYALMNKPKPAVHWLQAASDDGYPCYTLFDTDPNLMHIRTDRQFIEFMARLKKEWEHFAETF